MQWNRIFRENEIFPHPNIYIDMGKTENPPFLETFAEIIFELRQFARNNENGLSYEAVTLHLQECIIPKIYENLKKDCEVNNQPAYQEFLQCFHVKSISSVTAWRWLKSIGFSCCERKKNYFTDKHEDDEEDTIKMEENSEVQLLKNSYIEFECNKKKIREINIDTHPKFYDLTRFQKKFQFKVIKEPQGNL